MPHLHLPLDHTKADLDLAADVADVVGSADLYVAWSHAHGAGEIPEVEAVVRQPEPAPASPFAEVLAAACAGLVALWQVIASRPAAQRPAVPPAVEPPRRRAAGEPSA
jgi:hypothetical protein